APWSEISPLRNMRVRCDSTASSDKAFWDLQAIDFSAASSTSRRSSSCSSVEEIFPRRRIHYN
ncbi:MAG: hypothetical protein ACXVBX_16240, partial [Flavisolibacter sp.]